MKTNKNHKFSESKPNSLNEAKRAESNFFHSNKIQFVFESSEKSSPKF